MNEPIQPVDPGQAHEPGHGVHDSAALEQTQTEHPSERSDSGSHSSGLQRKSAGQRSKAETVSTRSRVLALDDTDRYLFVEEHAHGGLGRVAKARDQRLSRVVAIKELLRQSDFAEALFVREALITARLQHPGIVPVHDAGRWPTGEPYYVMKLVAGKSLRELIREHKTLTERLALLPNVIAVAETIAYAHSEGVIHRDIKPANVLVGDFGETVVVDWGLAADRKRPGSDDGGEGVVGQALERVRSDAFEAMIDAALGATIRAGTDDDSEDPGQETGQEDDQEDDQENDQAKYSVSGKVIGTPAYMSPEQARGDEVDTRSDIYALGALLYEVLAGQRPYPGKNPHEVLTKVLSGPPQPVDQRVSGVPPELLTIVAKAMARRPRDRYRSAKQFCEDLKRFQTGQLVAAHDYSTVSLVKRWMWRHRSPVAVASAGLVIMAVMAVLGVNQIVAQRNRARLGWTQAEVAQHAAEDRQNELLLLQAESALLHDPTHTLAWLKQVPVDDSTFARARAMADEAVALGVASHVFRHENSVFAVAFVPGRSALATLGWDGGVRIWDVDTGAVRVVGTMPDPIIAEMAVSPDGAYLATTGSRGSVLVWSLDGGARHALPALPRRAKTIEFGPDSKEIVITMAGQVTFWDFASGRVRTITRPDADEENASELMAVSMDGQRLVYPEGNILIVRDGDAAAEVARIAVPDAAHEAEEIVQLVFHPDGARVLVRTAQSNVYLVDIDSRRVRLLGRQPAGMESASFSSSGRYVATSHQIHDVAYVWDLEEKTLWRTLVGHEDGIHHTLFSHDERRLITAGDDGTTRVWDLATQQVRILRGHTDDAYRAAISRDGTMVASAGVDGQARLWRLPDSHVLGGPQSPGGELAFTPSGQLVSQRGSKDIRVWDLATGTSRHIDDFAITLPQNIRWSYGMVASADGRHLASAQGSAVVLWQMPAGKRYLLDAGDSGTAIRRLMFGGNRLISLDQRGRVTLWDLHSHAPSLLFDDAGVAGVQVSADGALLAVEFAHAVEVWNLAERRMVARTKVDDVELHAWNLPRWMMFSPDNQWLLLQVRNVELHLWHISTGQMRMPQNSDIGALSIAFSPDSKEVAVATGDRLIHVWPLAGGEPEVFSNHTDLIYEVLYSPDGSVLASSSHDKTVRLWNRKTGRSRVLRGHQSAVLHLAFSPDGSLLASSSMDGIIRLWPMGSDPIETPTDLRAFLDANTKAVIGAGDRLGSPEPDARP